MPAIGTRGNCAHGCLGIRFAVPIPELDAMPATVLARCCAAQPMTAANPSARCSTAQCRRIWRPGWHFYLPSYSPELNPEERLNANLKHAIGTKVPVRTKAKLKAAATQHMTDLEQGTSKNLIRACPGKIVAT